jgi:hypothetical protein
MAGYPWRYDDFTHAGRKDTIVIGLLTPAEAVAPQGMALNTIEVGVTVIGSAVVAVPFMVALATGNVVAHKGVLVKVKLALPPE